MVKRKRKNNLILYLVICVFIISLIVFLYTLYAQSKVILKKQEIIIKLVVGDKAGFIVTNDSLNFGGLYAGTSSQKEIILPNNYGFPIKAEFSVEGNIKDFLVYAPVIYLETGEKKNVTISTIQIPKDAVYGNYSGIMTIVFKRV